ncbi:MAG TPA: hypothetical protein DCR65_09130 [Gammaproteobacteria bacterium]|nr:hypothetical protein [Gammaproteobacteria bacterium]
MSIEQRRTKLIFAIFEELATSGRTEIRPGDITTVLRERNQPLAFWEVRGELSNLEAAGVIEVDSASGGWRLTADSARKAG